MFPVPLQLNSCNNTSINLHARHSALVSFFLQLSPLSLPSSLYLHCLFLGFLPSNEDISSTKLPLSQSMVTIVYFKAGKCSFVQWFGHWLADLLLTFSFWASPYPPSLSSFLPSTNTFRKSPDKFLLFFLLTWRCSLAGVLCLKLLMFRWKVMLKFWYFHRASGTPAFYACSLIIEPIIFLHFRRDNPMVNNIYHKKKKGNYYIYINWINVQWS